MRILIADDHAVVRRGLREILAEAFPAAQFNEAGNGDEVVGHLAESPYAVLVLDINMPGRSGLEVLQDVKRSHPKTAVIVLSVQPEDQYAVRCLRVGASGYLNKDSAPEQLVLAVKKVLGGGRYVSAALAEKLVVRLSEPAEQAPHEQLSDRELEVMKMIAIGRPLTEVADQLHISVKTVSSYRARIMEKMQMESNAELVRYALEHNLIH